MSTISTTDSHDLTRLEGVIRRGLQSFIEVGNALAEIRDRRLYRSTHSTFETYCVEQWGMQRQYANRLVAAASVVNSLVPIGTKLPDSESQVRPLTKIPKAQQAAVWTEAVATSPNGRPTAARVQKIIDTKLTKVPIVDPEFSELLPACPAATDTLLAESIQANGCMDPLLVWKQTGILLDGHRRLKVCLQHGIPFNVTEISLDDRDDAIVFILELQLGRKNLTELEQDEITERHPEWNAASLPPERCVCGKLRAEHDDAAVHGDGHGGAVGCEQFTWTKFESPGMHVVEGGAT